MKLFSKNKKTLAVQIYKNTLITYLYNYYINRTVCYINIFLDSYRRLPFYILSSSSTLMSFLSKGLSLRIASVNGI